jgi:hypothetical protein
VNVIRVEAKGCSQLEDYEPTTAERYQTDLNDLIEERADIVDTIYLHHGDPFEAAYTKLADTIVMATNMYVALRSLEERLLDGATDAT